MFKISGEYTVVRDYIEYEEEIGNTDATLLFGKKVNIDVCLYNKGLFLKGFIDVEGKKYPAIGKNMGDKDFLIYYANEKGEMYSFCFTNDKINKNYNSIAYCLVPYNETYSLGAAFFSNAKLFKNDKVSAFDLEKIYNKLMEKAPDYFENFVNNNFGDVSYKSLEDFDVFKDELYRDELSVIYTSSYIPFYDIFDEVEENINEYMKSLKVPQGEIVEISKEKYLEIANQVIDKYCDDFFIDKTAREELLEDYYEVASKNDDSAEDSSDFYKTDLVALHVVDLISKNSLYMEQSCESVDMLLSYALCETTDNKIHASKIIDIFKNAYATNNEDKYIIDRLENDKNKKYESENIVDILSIYKHMKDYYEELKILHKDGDKTWQTFTFEQMCDEIKEQTSYCFEEYNAENEEAISEEDELLYAENLGMLQ